MQGKAVKELREQSGVSQFELAQMIGADITQVSRYENGHTPISPETWRLIEKSIAERVAYKIDLSAQFKAARVSQGYTLQGLASKAGVSYQLIMEFENGKRYPQYRSIRKIAQALGIDLSVQDNGQITPQIQNYSAIQKGLTRLLNYCDTVLTLYPEDSDIFRFATKVQNEIDTIFKTD